MVEGKTFIQKEFTLFQLDFEAGMYSENLLKREDCSSRMTMDENIALLSSIFLYF